MTLSAVLHVIKPCKHIINFSFYLKILLLFPCLTVEQPHMKEKKVNLHLYSRFMNKIFKNFQKFDGKLVTLISTSQCGD